MRIWSIDIRFNAEDEPTAQELKAAITFALETMPNVLLNVDGPFEVMPLVQFDDEVTDGD